MFLPFVLATSFVTIACANTLYARGIQVRGAVDAAHALEPLIGLTLGRVVFSLGVLRHVLHDHGAGDADLRSCAQ